MKCLVCVEPGKFGYEERVIPVPREGHSLIKINSVGICGTDLHAFKGEQPYFNYPRILGHEIAAEYVDGDAPGFAAGDEISVIPYFNCGTCIACRTGKPNCCTQIAVCGVHIDGAMCEYLQVPDYSLLKGAGLTRDELALVEPLSIGAHAVRRAGVQAGEFVLVVGAGPIGIGIMEFARIAGAEVIVLDVNEGRLQFCKESLHFEHILNGKEEALVQLLKITSGDMPVVVFDATGNRQAIEQAFSYMAHTGRYVLVGLQKEHIGFSHPEFHKREGTLMSSRNATKADFEYVINMIRQKRINPAAYVTQRIKFDNAATEFKSLFEPDTHVCKAIIEMN